MVHLSLFLVVAIHARDDGTCTAWRGVEELGTVDNAELTEVSGLTASHVDPGVLWMHNDRGGGNALYAVGLQGDSWGRYELVAYDNEDWEDLAPGPCPHFEAPCTCLHLADIGDNDLERGGGVVYRVEEPTVTRAAVVSQMSPLDEVHFRYPDGPHDAEAVLVHPDTGEVLVLTKGQETGVYAFPTIPPQPAPSSNPVDLERVTTFDLTDHGADEAAVTGGAVSPRGWRVVLRTDEDLMLFSGAMGSSLEDVLGRDPVPLPTPPPGRGEAVAFGSDGRRLYVVGEGEQPPVHVVECASFVSDGEDAWDPLVDCEGGCGCAGASRHGATPLLGLLALLGLRMGRRNGTW